MAFASPGNRSRSPGPSCSGASTRSASRPGAFPIPRWTGLRLLVEKGSLEVEQAQRDAASAVSNQKIKENDCKAAQEKLDRHRISAPIAGVVVRVYRNRGEWVKPGEPVVRILRLDRLRAEGFLKSRDLTPGLQGRTVKLAVDLPGDAGREFLGKISFVDPEVDPVNSQVRVWVEVQNQDLRLRPGMQAKMIMPPRQDRNGAAKFPKIMAASSALRLGKHVSEAAAHRPLTLRARPDLVIVPQVSWPRSLLAGQGPSRPEVLPSSRRGACLAADAGRTNEPGRGQAPLRSGVCPAPRQRRSRSTPFSAGFTKWDCCWSMCRDRAGNSSSAARAGRSSSGWPR